MKTLRVLLCPKCGSAPVHEFNKTAPYYRGDVCEVKCCDNVFNCTSSAGQRHHSKRNAYTYWNKKVVGNTRLAVLDWVGYHLKNLADDNALDQLKKVHARYLVEKQIIDQQLTDCELKGVGYGCFVTIQL